MRLTHLVAAMLLMALLPIAAPAQQANSEAGALWDEWSRLSRAGQHDEAIAVAQKRLSLAERMHGPESEDAANVLENIGGGYRKKQDDANAERYYVRALAIYEKLPAAQQN